MKIHVNVSDLTKKLEKEEWNEMVNNIKELMGAAPPKYHKKIESGGGGEINRTILVSNIAGLVYTVSDVLKFSTAGSPIGAPHKFYRNEDFPLEGK